MSFKHWLYKTGANPQRSLLIFVAGFAVFVCGAYLVASDYYYVLIARIAGYILIAIGFYFGVKGWLGIMANRISLFINVPGGRFSDNKSTKYPD